MASLYDTAPWVHYCSQLTPLLSPRFVGGDTNGIPLQSFLLGCFFRSQPSRDPFVVFVHHPEKRLCISRHSATLLDGVFFRIGVQLVPKLNFPLIFFNVVQRKEATDS